jgi:trigger factor
MKTTLTRETSSKVRMQIEASADEIAPALARAVKSLGSEIKVPGFRKGHVPRKILESRVGTDAVRDATLREALPELLAKALGEDDTLVPVSAPRVEQADYEVGGDLSLEALVDVRPEIQLPDFSTLTATRPVTEATESEIDDQLARLQDRFASLDAAARPARGGDFIACDIRTTQHDVEVAEFSGKDQLYQVGSAWPVPAFDAELTGAKAGDIVRFNGTLPEGLGEHSGKDVTFQVLVKEVRQKVTPALDDEFAKTASEYDTLGELRSDLAGRIKEVKVAQAEGAISDQVLQQVIDDVEVEPPESLVVEEMAFRLQRFEQRLGQASMSLDDYLASQEVTEEQLETDLRRQAERNIKAQLILEEIGRREAFQVGEDELREEVRRHAEMLRTDPADLQEQLSDRGRLLALAGDIIRRKALNLLVERADIKEEDATASDPAPSSKETSDA